MSASDLSVDLLSVLEKVAEREGFKKPKFSVGRGIKPGDNYVGVVHRVKVEETDKGRRNPSVSLIVKRQPDSEIRRTKFRTGTLFDNEAVVYNEVIPAFLRFQEEKGIKENFSPPHPRCLRAGELLILEDQGPLGFIMKDRREPLDAAHCLLIMRVLGRLHALSFALKDQKPTLFKELAGTVKETLLNPAEMPTIICNLFENAGTQALKIFEEYSSQPRKRSYLEAVTGVATNLSDTLVNMVRGEDAEPYAVINHGDCWTSNILFKYMKENPIPQEACLLDFQLSRFASPACDLSYFLYCCTDGATRRAHYTQFLQEYHSSLASHLTRLGSDVSKMFPMEALQDQMKRFGKYGLGLAMVTIPMFTSNSEDIPDLDAACTGNDEEFINKFSFDKSKNNICAERLCDVIVDIVDLGYIL